MVTVEPMSSSENSLVGDEADEDMLMVVIVATVDDGDVYSRCDGRC